MFATQPIRPIHESAGPRHEISAATSVLLLAMVAICLLGLPFLRGVSLRPYRVYAGGTLIMFGVLVAFRLRAPNEFHEDFRHIVPALVPLCLAFAKIFERYEHRAADESRPGRWKNARIGVGAQIIGAAPLRCARRATRQRRRAQLRRGPAL